MEPNLTVNPEVVQEFNLDIETGNLVREIAEQYGMLDAYNDYRFGSGYYVELPRYIQYLFEIGEWAELTGILHDAFNGNRISEGDWRKIEAIDCK